MSPDACVAHLPHPDFNVGRVTQRGVRGGRAI
jgi:hypothetical protein